MQIKKIFQCGLVSVAFLILNACMVGPDYKRPAAETPSTFKESRAKDWKIAQPNDDYDRGEWWLVFHDAQLNALEAKLNITNQTIKSATAQYVQALALLDQARANYFPTFSTSISVQRQKQVSFGNSVSVTTNTAQSTTPNSNVSVGTISSGVFNSHALLFNASWAPDLWGSVGRAVEASRANAQSSAALVASARLSAQASLAQIYFQIRALDTDQWLLDRTVNEYQEALSITQHRYAAGVAPRSDVVQARAQLETAKATAINNKISRSQFEHAAAVLVGVPPAVFTIKANPLRMVPPPIPLEAPSELLERRPDVASAERLMAQANAQIGVAISAFFPSLTLTGTSGVQRQGLNYWFSIPAMSWALGAQLSQTILDGGMRMSAVYAARANYKATVATYRQTVLTAFQNVEDNLVSLRELKERSIYQNKAARDAREALRLVMNQYKAGIVIYSSVITAQINAFNAEKAAADVNGLRMTAAVGLIQALGGGWDAMQIPKA